MAKQVAVDTTGLTSLMDRSPMRHPAILLAALAVAAASLGDPLCCLTGLDCPELARIQRDDRPRHGCGCCRHERDDDGRAPSRCDCQVVRRSPLAAAERAPQPPETTSVPALPAPAPVRLLPDRTDGAEVHASEALPPADARPARNLPLIR